MLGNKAWLLKHACHRFYTSLAGPAPQTIDNPLGLMFFETNCPTPAEERHILGYPNEWSWSLTLFLEVPKVTDKEIVAKWQFIAKNLWKHGHTKPAFFFRDAHSELARCWYMLKIYKFVDDQHDDTHFVSWTCGMTEQTHFFNGDQSFQRRIGRSRWARPSVPEVPEVDMNWLRVLRSSRASRGNWARKVNLRDVVPL